MALPSRAVWPSGAAAWLWASVARGTPPNGQFHRSSSPTTTAPGSASQRHGRCGGTRATATPNIAAYRAHATTYPGGVRSNIHNIIGYSHAAAMSHVRRKRRAHGWSATSRSHWKIPRKASGHQPKGGIEAARVSPASTQRPSTTARLSHGERSAVGGPSRAVSVGAMAAPSHHRPPRRPAHRGRRGRAVRPVSVGRSAHSRSRRIRGRCAVGLGCSYGPPTGRLSTQGAPR